MPLDASLHRYNPGLLQQDTLLYGATVRMARAAGLCQDAAMELSPQGYDLLVQREAKRNTVYLDSEGKPTCGIGHYDPALVVGDVWTDEQVEAAFRSDSAWTLACLGLVHNDLQQNQFDALFSFIWNIGQGQWRSSTMLRMLNAGTPADQVALQFDRWHTPPAIISRRNGEREQFKGTAFEARIA